MERKSTKRRRAALACDSCRRKKIRCDTNRPACDNCTHSKIKCVYTEALRKKPTAAPRRNDTAGRLERIESILYALVQQKGGSFAGLPLPLSTQQSSDGESGAESGAEQDDVEDSLDEASDDHNAKSFGENISMMRVSHGEENQLYTHAISGTLLSQKSLKWLETKINDPALFERLRQSIQSLFVQQQQRINWYTENILNPMSLDVEFMRTALRYFSTSNLPFMNALLTVHEADELSKMRWDSLSLASRLVACSVTVLMSFWLGREEVYRDLKYSPEYLQRQGTLFLSHAGKYAQSLALAVPNMAVIRAYAMFVMALDKVQMPSTSVFYTMLTMNLAVSMGMNRVESYRGMSEEAKERRKATWWLIYVMERDMSIRLGRAPVVADSEVSTELTDISDGDFQKICVYHLIQLSRIYGKVYRKLFSVAAQSRSRSQHFLDVVSLLNELETWKERLPQKLKLMESGDISIDTNSIIDLSYKKMIVRLHSSYYEVSVTVARIAAFSPSGVQAFLKRHQDPARRTNQNSPGQGNGSSNSTTNTVFTPTENVNLTDEDIHKLTSAMDICREGARRILRLSNHLLEIGCGSLISGAVTYLTSAFITLFAANMASPTDPKSIADRELMRKYLPLFSMQKIELEGPSSHPVTDFWSVMVEILDRYHDRVVNGGLTEGPLSSESPTKPVVAPIPSYPNESYAVLNPTETPLPADNALANDRLPVGGGWVQDSLFLDPQVEGSVNWMMRDAYDGLNQFSKSEEEFPANLGELANDMYMMSGFYGV